MKWKQYIKAILEAKGHEVEVNASSDYIIVNNSILAQVKTSPYYYGKRSQLHTFNLKNVSNECNVLICIGLDEEENISRCLVMPRNYFKDKKSISCGVYSRHDDYKDRWQYLIK